MGLDSEKEIEVKILEVNRPELEKTLNSLGAEKIFDGEIETLFFDTKDRSITMAKNVLRLRKENGKTTLTYKRVRTRKNAKTAQEFSVEISDAKVMQEILEQLGFSITGGMKKHRVSYRVNKTRFDFDAYEEEHSFIPEFLEIEADSITMIYKYAQLLGFKPEECLPWSSQDLVLYYTKKTRKTNR